MQNEEKDEYQIELDKKKQSVQECQKERGFESCFTCKELLDCSLRKEYIYAVYQSMSKGQSGGFEF